MASTAVNRDFLIQELSKELVGPDPRGAELDCNSDISFPDLKSSFGPWFEKGTGEEILQRDFPINRYGVGVLYPMKADDDLIEATAPVEPDLEGNADVLFENAERDLTDIAARSDSGGAETDTDDFDLSSTNQFRPSSIGVSFIVRSFDGAILRIQGSGGRYKPLHVKIGTEQRIWYVRTPVRLDAEVPLSSLGTRPGPVKPIVTVSENLGDIDLRIEPFARPGPDAGTHLLTVCLVNRTPHSKGAAEHSLFQTHLHAFVESDTSADLILPYRGVVQENPDDEEQSLSLLYRNAETFAIGHGCAADWVTDATGQFASAVSAVCLPAFETPSITPELKRRDGSLVEVSMNALADLKDSNFAFAILEEIVQLYESWIEQQRDRISGLPVEFEAAGTRHMATCLRCAERMRKGIAFLRSNSDAWKAFQLANMAVLLQQLQSRRDTREISYDARQKRLNFSEEIRRPDISNVPEGKGKWRPFQIAFLLIAVESTANPLSTDRLTVDLIWFPTGGGKTEAYLGLTAFAAFYRRLQGPGDTGTTVLMRYTLRLLTAQQFQRSATLLCAMEYLRRGREAELGDVPFSIGLWLGGSNTPNTRTDARSAYRKLCGKGTDAKNPFAITKCPWCAAQMGPVDLKEAGTRSRGAKTPTSIPLAHGYEPTRGSVYFRCPDPECVFTDEMPVYVIDEDIYELHPTMVIGTVDKFAMLSWKPEARGLFGIDSDGTRISSPPSLVLQDELHLISGPLGSMVGLYEAVVEELCTDRRTHAIPPKIVTATATIRRFARQVADLYGRESVELFPPPGLDAGDSFFAHYAQMPDGTLERGRIYVGVHGPGLRSLQTAQVRTFTSLLQAPADLPIEERDPWWTLLIFFNSLRELGTTLSLLQSDIPDYFGVMRNRRGASYGQMRRLARIKELTGRLPSEDVPLAISALDTPYGDKECIDVCMASNIIEVGVDIDRLSLIAVVGQPKTTSQYIQVTGRVGRQWWTRPGLVVTIYVPSKPRDRSHFEKFRSYHERLYAQVEPTSVTPFSRPSLERALHAVLAAFVRQSGTPDEANSPTPVPDQLLSQIEDVLRDRVAKIDRSALADFELVLQRRRSEWRRWERLKWTGSFDGDAPLLRPAGAYASPEQKRVSWATPQSMRNVDAECQVEITSLYIAEEDQEKADA